MSWNTNKHCATHWSTTKSSLRNSAVNKSILTALSLCDCWSGNRRRTDTVRQEEGHVVAANVQKYYLIYFIFLSPWFSSLCPPLLSTGIRPWRMALSQTGPSSPATTQYTSAAVTTSNEWALLPGNTGMERWAGPRTCSTSDRGISCRKKRRDEGFIFYMEAFQQNR